MQPNVEVTGHQDPDDEAPWAMQLVVRVEKADPPTHTAVCEAAAMAVVRFIDDDQAAPGGPWRPAMDRWMAGRIRKHCRRARGAAWHTVANLPGVTVDHCGAQVRAFVPGPTDSIPREIAKLQLSGSELADPHVRTHATPTAGGPLLVAITPQPHLSLGKAAAAAGHAAQLAYLQMSDDRRDAWRSAGFPAQVVHPTVDRWNDLLHTAPVVIKDAGLTVVAAGTCTAVAHWA